MQHYWRAFICPDDVVTENLWGLFGYSPNVIGVFFLVFSFLHFIIHQMLSSSGMTFHINLLFVTHLFFLLCFGPTLLCKVTPNMWLYKPLSNIVHLSVCCFCFVFLNVPSLYWCELQCQCSQEETWPASGQFPQTLDETQDVCVSNVLGISAQHDCYLLDF